MTRSILFLCMLCMGAVLAVSQHAGAAWNNPYAGGSQDQVLYLSFSERPKHLDPVRSYSSNEYAFLGQIYEPVLQYHYLKRPYELEPLTAAMMPALSYVDADGNAAGAADSAFTIYDITLKPGILFQPHPAFAKTADGEFLYHLPGRENFESAYALSDFPHTGTRELRAADYAYQIKRLADPTLHSPIAGILAKHIVGFSELTQRLADARAASPAWLDLRNFDFPGVEVLGPHRYRITVRSGYPQFIYWLAMPFFSAMPWEADTFYARPGLAERNITLDWYPLGTGAYMLTENNPNMRMVLERNPNFRADYYPGAGEDGDAARGLLADAGARLPFINKAVYSLEKENIPYWNKFLQGYYDSSGISSDSFDQTIQFSQGGEFELTGEMRARGIKLSISYQTSITYIGFNMLDPVVGGFSERARKLRRALSIAVDMEEYISIFLNGRGLAAQGPLPPGIFGYRVDEAGVNRRVYEWRNGRAVRKPLDAARSLLAEAGYTGGVDQRTGKPLVLYFDSVGTGPDVKSWLNWMRKQFDKLDIQLVIRSTDYNRFQDKMLKGRAQIYRWGWNADYPDPENFMFLFYGPNSKVEHQGENASNYRNAEFDRLFERMRGMSNSEPRLAVIAEMEELLRRDTPWIWGFHPRSFVLHHAWLGNAKPNLMTHNNLKYLRVNPGLREQRRQEWNAPRLVPVAAFVAALLLFVLPAVQIHRKRRRRAAL